MKKLLNIVSESKQVNECGMNMPTNPVPSVPPVSMSVNLNAQGIDQIKDLLNLMNKADSPLAPGVVGQGPAPMPMALPIGMEKPEGPKEPDMKDLIKIASAPKEEPNLDDLSKETGMDADAVKSDVKSLAPSDSGDEPAPKKEMQAVADEVKGLASELAKENENEGYANSPDEQVADADAAVPSGDDLHKQKKSYSDKPFRGDNPMAVEQLKQDLASMYKHIKETR